MHAVLLSILALELFPLYVMAITSAKNNRLFVENPWLPTIAGWGEVFLSNLRFAWVTVMPYILNTLWVAAASAFVTLLFALLSAYFFARYKLPFSGPLWAIFLVLMLMPSIANIVPLFAILRDLSLLNSLWALIVVNVAGGQVFNLFILRNFIEEIPRDLFDAAEMDGASHLQQIWHIVVPMSRAILGTLAILIVIGSWNEYLLPLLVLRDASKFTLGVGLIYLDGEFVKNWGEVMAAFLMASVPLIALFAVTMRWFVQGLASGAVKG